MEQQQLTTHEESVEEVVTSDRTPRMRHIGQGAVQVGFLLTGGPAGVWSLNRWRGRRCVQSEMWTMLQTSDTKARKK